jgi:hypothetical protein
MGPSPAFSFSFSFAISLNAQDEDAGLFERRVAEAKALREDAESQLRLFFYLDSLALVEVRAGDVDDGAGACACVPACVLAAAASARPAPQPPACLIPCRLGPARACLPPLPPLSS